MPDFSIARRVYLWGLPGSGKTSLGRPLAELLGFEFVDLDALIEERSGWSIPRIFENKGEAYFRKLEEEALMSIGDMEAPLVVACGGGTPCRPGNNNFMQASGICVYLKVPLSVLTERLVKDSGTRPLLDGMGTTEIARWLASMEKERGPWYEMADILFEMNGKGALGDACHSLRTRIEQMPA